MNVWRYIGAVGMCAVALTWGANAWAESTMAKASEAGTNVSGIREVIPAGDMALPPRGEAGKCYARVWVDAEYGTEQERLLAKEAGERIEIVPAQFEMQEERVLVREGFDRLEAVPAQYKTVTEKILIKPAQTAWKKGRGLIEKVDNFTGEIMCLVEVPAEYKTITKRVLVEPATVRTVHVPAEYKTVQVQKLTAPPEAKRIAIPADYQTITRTVMLNEGYMEWKEVECETNAPQKARAMFEEQAKAVEPEVEAEPAAEPETMTRAESDDWFLLWKYDPLFDQGKWEIAERK